MLVASPHRASHTYVQQLIAPPGKVFPLLCPVREADWIEGWNPLLVVSESGTAEADCVFITPAEPHDAIWYIVRHDPVNFYVEMLKITPAVTACKLSIQLAPQNEGSTATITYTQTSLGPEGDQVVAEFTKDHYTDFMQDWEALLNNYLQINKT